MTTDTTPSRVLAPLKLTGGSQLPNRILPGPMEGIMTPDFCRVMMEFDLVSAWITPFVRILDSVPRLAILKRRLNQYRGRPMVVQLMGTNRQSLVAGAIEVAKFDGVLGVELNCACPSKKVLSSGAGSALLSNPIWIRDTLRAIREELPNSGVGVKVRAGLESPDEAGPVMEAVAQASPDYVVMHYRTATEMYRKIPDGWKRFKYASERLGTIPLLASGDLLTVDACEELLATTDVDGITPARGLLKNPWLLRELEAKLTGNACDSHDVVPFLKRLIELGEERPNWRFGNVLDVAKLAWGEDSHAFKRLLKEPTASGMLKALGQ